MCTKMMLPLFYGVVSVVHAWTQEQLDMYDLVEEVNANFYDMLDIPMDASASQIRKAFRTKSLSLHPDRNDAPDAEVQFRNLVAATDVCLLIIFIVVESTVYNSHAHVFIERYVHSIACDM
eukprot:m.334730 g.334730  ORF g.334730 m.334730 type:complete len:121 (-) comp20513_c0_seq3:2192-2554(-)